VLQAVLVLAVLSAAAEDPVSRITGSIAVHEVRAGETLDSLAARAGLEVATLARDNQLSRNARLSSGQRLIVDNRHIVPFGISDGIVVNIPQRMLFLMVDEVAIRAFPVAVGRADWRTPLGSFAIALKEINPVWDVPTSIQRELARAGRRVLTRVPPGPDNPLGGHWMRLTAGAVGIHGTNQPSSIYRATTHGCIRMHSDDAAELFALVETGTPVHIIYEPVLVAVVADGTYVEVHPDVYRKLENPLSRAKELLDENAVEREVEAAELAATISQRAGRVVRITAGREN
jgi:L,D-transpeptidase ErfK/SrfK